MPGFSASLDAFVSPSGDSASSFGGNRFVISARILVSMTRTRKTLERASARSGKWALQDAKARFSEVVRKAKTEGPQRITVHGREEVVVVSVEDYRRVKGQPTGQALVDVMQASPARDIRIERTRTRARVRDVEL